MSKEFPVPRFPILGFRIPKSVWHMGILEYRGKASRHEIAGRGAGAGGRAGPGTATGGGIGHRMSNTNSGVGHGMTNGVPGRLVRDPGATLWAKEGGPKGDRH